MGVSLSHLNLLLVTFSNSSPARSQVREYVCPSIGDPVGVMSSVKGGTIKIMTLYQAHSQTSQKGGVEFSHTGCGASILLCKIISKN